MPKLSLHAMDFPGVLELYHSILPSLNEPGRRPWHRFCLALWVPRMRTGRTSLMTARNEMDPQKMTHDWYSRMILEQALTDVSLATGRSDAGRAT
jgi:hypothetical protein